MAHYRIERRGHVVEIRHVRRHMIVLGLMFAVPGAMILALGAREPATGRGLLASFMGLVALAAGITCILLPCRFLARLDCATGELSMDRRGLLSRRRETRHGVDARALEIVETEGTEGSWYTPAIRCAGGELLEIGFGAGVREAAEETLDRLRAAAAGEPPSLR